MSRRYIPDLSAYARYFPSGEIADAEIAFSPVFVVKRCSVGAVFGDFAGAARQRNHPAARPVTITAASAAIANERLEYTPGTRVVYSDLGFITLGFLLERLAGKGFAELTVSEIIEPLKLTQTFLNPELAIRKRIAASERGRFFSPDRCVIASLTLKKRVF